MAHLLLIDALNLIRRLYAVQERPYLPVTDEVAEGTKTQIIRNTENMLRQALARLQQELAPSHAVLVFDGRNSLWRKTLYAEYKANRSETPEDLIPQFPMIRDATRAFSLPLIEEEDVEADDMIASYAKAASAARALRNCSSGVARLLPRPI